MQHLWSKGSLVPVDKAFGGKGVQSETCPKRFAEAPNAQMEGKCSVMNSCKTSVMYGLSTAVLCKNLSLSSFSWLGVHPGGETR